LFKYRSYHRALGRRRAFQTGSFVNTDTSTTGASARGERFAFHATSISASLTVNDLQKSLAWYQDMIGFAVDRKHEFDGQLRAISLKAGDVRLLINQDNGARGFDRAKGVGFSLQLTTNQNVDEIAKRITALGGKLESEPADMPWGARVFRVKDPDGFMLVITSNRSA
jgi:uncharacterized glyoxalase superfamily protein PhnB